MGWKRAEKKLDSRDAEKEQEKAEGQALKQKIMGDLELLKKANQLMLRDSLWRKIECHLKDGYCPQDEKLRIQEIYEIYHSLGENGIMDSDIEKLHDLPPIPKRSDDNVLGD